MRSRAKSMIAISGRLADPARPIGALLVVAEIRFAHSQVEEHVNLVSI